MNYKKTPSKSPASGQELEKSGLKAIALEDLDGVCGGNPISLDLENEPVQEVFKSLL